jgi:TRAP-type C4-dicarboxylate transport system substrate-binding protein
MSQTRKIRWLIAHEPVNLFLRTAQAFSAKLAELTNGKFDVEIYTASEYREEFNTTADPMVLMEAGSLEMSQLHITELAKWHSPEFFALELPFLFRDHDHAQRVLEGKIGKLMLSGLKETSPAEGLAFTYSGGFRCVISEDKIEKLEDLKGINFATATNPVTIDTVEAFGAIPNAFTIADFAKNVKDEGSESQAFETTIPRYLAQFKDTSKKNMTNTKHSLFLTAIIISNEFWSSLDQTTKDQFNEACLHASRLERKWSVEDAEAFAAKQDHSDIGITYSEFSPEETAKFKELVQPIYDKYTEFFYPGLVDGIIKS